MLGFLFEAASIGLTLAVFINRLKNYRKRLAQVVLYAVGAVLIYGSYIAPDLDDCRCPTDGEPKTWAVISVLAFTSLAVLVLVESDQWKVGDKIRRLWNQL